MIPKSRLNLRGDFEKSSQLTGSVALPTPTKSRARFPFDFDSAREGPKHPLPHPTSTRVARHRLSAATGALGARGTTITIPRDTARSTHSAAHILTYLSHMKPCDSRSLRRVTALSWCYQRRSTNMTVHEYTDDEIEVIEL